MILSDIAITVTDLEKVYRRYSSNGWRAASLFGLPVPASKYDQFWALNKVSFTIGRGERVALVGRNGAGKSTLLRHISGELTPTAGKVDVHGKVKALFGLGEGFHPEFSGLDNIKTALALHGFRWKDIPSAVEEIIEFTELEDFINRPLKEYSAGMYARLAFATATAAKPDILIIDEILGAGDAYFLGKCLQRIRDITADGATVLFVSHDMGSALMLCQRGVWIHQGKLREDGEMTLVARKYQAHIRDEQELALRARSMKLSKKTLAQQSESTLLRLIGIGESTPDEPLHVSRLAFGEAGLAFGETHLGNQDMEGEIVPLIDLKTANWGKSLSLDGRLCRPFGDFGGSFIHAPFTIRQSSGLTAGAWVELDVRPSPTTDVDVQLYDEADGEYRTIGVIPASTDRTWRTVRFNLGLVVAERNLTAVAEETPEDARLEKATGQSTYVDDPVVGERTFEDAAAEPVEPKQAEEAITVTESGTIEPPERTGNRTPEATVAVRAASIEPPAPVTASRLRGKRPFAQIRNFSFVDSDGVGRHTLISGEPMGAVFDFEARNLPELPIAVVAIYKPDGTVVSQMISPRAKPASMLLTGNFRISFHLDELLIGPGDFIVSAALFRELDPNKAPDDCAYDLRDRSFALKVLEADLQTYPTGLVRQNPIWSFGMANGTGEADTSGLDV